MSAATRQTHLLVTEVFGAEKLGWLKALNASARIWIWGSRSSMCTSVGEVPGVHAVERTAE
jgi:hypothetical protein